MKCSNCGSEILSTERFCRTCGQPVDYGGAPMQKPKKKRGCLVAVITFLLIAGAIALCIAIFLPGFFGPKNLGIKTSKGAYNSALEKLNYQKDSAPVTGSAEDYSYTYGEIRKVSAALTSEELTSFFNYNRPDYYPLKKVQIRITPENTLEFSAAVNTDYVFNSILGGKYSKEEITKAYPAIKLIPDTVNVYGEISGEIANNKSENVELTNFEVMGVDLPSSIYETTSAQEEINNVIDDILLSVSEKTGGSYNSIKVENGELLIDGDLPSSLTRKEAD